MQSNICIFSNTLDQPQITEFEFVKELKLNFLGKVSFYQQITTVPNISIKCICYLSHVFYFGQLRLAKNWIIFCLILDGKTEICFCVIIFKALKVAGNCCELMMVQEKSVQLTVIFHDKILNLEVYVFQAD